MTESPPPEARYLLCRPQGGFNDILCVIERCWRYAERFNRILVIDARRSGLRDDFSRYFSMRPPHQAELQLTATLAEILNSIDCYPSIVSRRINRYRGIYDDGRNSYVEVHSRIDLGFDFERDYSEPCLLYQQARGGNVGIDALARLSLNADLAATIGMRLAELGKGYCAVHVRNTDYRTDYRAYFTSIKAKVDDKRLLICSDDAECIRFARVFFDGSEVLTITNTPDLQGRPLHLHAVQAGYATAPLNVAMLTDLFALAMADELFVCRLSGAQSGRLPNNRLSGFSLLAIQLKKAFMGAGVDLNHMRVSSGPIDSTLFREMLKMR